MNKLIIIGNLTRDPELRYTAQKTPVCDFTVAVNRRTKSADGQSEADYFRVTVWRQLGEICAKYLSKGKKVCISGPVSLRTYQTQTGETRASLEVTAEDVEFLTPKDGAPASAPAPYSAPQRLQGGFTQVETDELPF